MKKLVSGENVFLLFMKAYCNESDFVKERKLKIVDALPRNHCAQK